VIDDRCILSESESGEKGVEEVLAWSGWRDVV